ncbi:MYXO-CTERM sorting domain-containing protein [Thermococcus sp.]|uniref:MYXO-CTERM sorting domain-containing protein n=1 Tax=Thermococcus sp. TaxID=35749 RepID=UPI00260FFEAB|nr:MYXO-CTERM sorting domain-containing protein [Thermococcus sp.]
MGRIHTLFKWEMNDLIKAILLFLGVLMAGMAMKQSLMHVKSAMSIASGTDVVLFGPSRSSGVSTSILELLSLDDVWMLLSFLLLLLGALTFRYDRDSGVARSVYSLPYSNDEIFGIKLLSSLVYGFLMFLLPFTYVVLTTYASIVNYLPEIVAPFIGHALTLTAFLLLYLIAVATLVSLASPNAFLAFMVGFAVIYTPRILGNSRIPPQLFIDAIPRSGSTNFTPFTAQYLGWGILVPLALLALSWVLIRRRDVV